MNRHPQVPGVVWLQTTQGFAARCTACGAQATAGTPQGVDDFAAAHQHPAPVRQAMGLGDVVAAATKAVGIAPCTPCQARQAKLNAMFPRLWRR
jgi:pantoate kinase